MDEEFEVLNSRAETFFIESIPWGTGLDHLGQSSAAGMTHVNTLRKQIATIKEAIEGSKPTPKPPRGEKRDRSPDDDEDLEALDESPDSAKRDRVSAATELVTELATELAKVKAVANELAKVRHEAPTPHVPSTWPNNPYSSPTTSSTRLSFSTRLFLCPRRGLNPKLHRLGPLSRLSRQRKRSR